jgi:flagellar biosynthesis protein FlhA
MPIVPFWLLAATLGGLGYYMSAEGKKAEEAAIVQQAEEEAAEEEAPKEEPISSILHIDTLRLELGYGLLNLIDESKGGKLTEQIKAMRRQMAKEIGFVVPSIRIQDNMQLEPGGYAISIKDITAGDGTLKAGYLLAMDPTGTSAPIEGEETVEPTFGLPARWIEEGKKEEASFNGYTVVDCSTVITTHLTEAIRENMSELLTRRETEKLIDEIRVENDKLIEELLPSKLSMGSLQKILQNLLQERVSIRDLPTILEALSDVAEGSRNIVELTEGVRTRLARQICTQHAATDGVINVVALSGAWEKEFSGSIHSAGESKQLAMEPAKVQSFIQTTHDIFEKHMMAGLQPVLLTSPTNRPFVRSILERTMPSIAILAQTEIYPKAKIKTVGTL